MTPYDVIRMYTVVSSLETSFIYLIEVKHYLSKWLGKERTEIMVPSKKELCYLC